MIATNQPSVLMTMDELNEIIRKVAITAAREVMNSTPAALDDGTLWDANQVAEYLVVSPETIKNKWKYASDFPAAIDLGEGQRVKSRWKASEIKAWAERKRIKKAA